MGGSKIIQDSVHGMIQLDPIAVLLVDTPEFQRLREIRQLGLAYLVYPSCQHTRFEHSIGTYYMASRLLESIQNDSTYNGPKLSPQECLEVKIASLCHDLGHGPFSHLWEAHMHAGGHEYDKYQHEKMSCRILERMVHNNSVLRQSLIEANVNLEVVKSLISGDPTAIDQTTLKKEPFFYEILSNHVNGMDVDKWDYLLRDCLHAGMGHGTAAIDLNRFMHLFRPALHKVEKQSTSGSLLSNGESTDEWHMSFRDTELENVLRTFGLRQYLHQKLYKHKTVTSITHMVLDALDLVEPVLHLRKICMDALNSENTDAMDRFLQLNDSMLWDIYHKRMQPIGDENSRSNIDLASALVHRILTRDIYTYVDSLYEVHTGESTFNSRKNSVSTSSRGASDLRTVVSCMGVREAFASETYLPECRLMKPLLNEGGDDTISTVVDGIYSRLPLNSGIKDKSSFLVVKCRFSSNSTFHAPHFYFYNRYGKTFVYDEPLRVVHAYRIYLKDSANENGADKSSIIIKLLEAFEQWYNETVARHKSPMDCRTTDS